MIPDVRPPVAEAVFGYGSLVWRPGFEPAGRELATLPDHARRFWQASHDHRGTPAAPGRVVTLVPLPGASCEGLVLGLPRAGREALLAELDERERDGYARTLVRPRLPDGRTVEAVTWVAVEGNPSWVGDDPDVAALIAERSGPSGRNADYLFELVRSLRALGVRDPYLDALERDVRTRLRS